MFLAGEALLLRRGDNSTIDDERCRAVVVEGRYTENAHIAIGRPRVRRAP